MADKTTDRLLEMATTVITGELFNGSPEDIKQWRESFGNFVDGINEIKRAYDVQLLELRKKKGKDFLPGVSFFRKPKGFENETKQETSTLSKLSL